MLLRFSSCSKDHWSISDNVLGSASLMALDGSALVFILYRAFSSGDSVRSTFGIEELLLLRFLPGKPSIDLGRDIVRSKDEGARLVQKQQER